jgi:hypothetical protein
MNSKLYPDYTKEIQAAKTSQATIKEGASKEAQADDIYEFKELIAITEAFTKSDKKLIDPFASYDLNLNIKELGETVIAKQPEASNDVQPFIEKAKVAIAEAAEKAETEQASSNIFSFYGWISDLKIASQTMVDISNILNNNLIPEMKEEIKEELTKETKDANAKAEKWGSGLLDGIRHHFKDLEERLEGVITKTGAWFGEAGLTLKNKLNEAGDWLKKNVVSKFVAAFKWLSEKFDAFRLMLFKRMFDFVRRVIDLANEKNWKIEHITVGMPELGFNMTEIGPIKIPIPTIKEPPVSFTFKPKIDDI